MGKLYFDNMPAVDIAALKTSLGIADEGNANDYFYLKTEVDALIKGAEKASLLLNLKDIGSTVKSTPFGATTYGMAGVAMTSQKIYGVTHVIRDEVLITGVEYGQTASASFTANNFCGFDLCSVNLSTGVLTQLAKTANDGTIFSLSAGYGRKSFLVPVTLTPGVYVVRALWSSSATTTAPALTLSAAANMNDYTNILGTVVKGAFYRSTQTDLVTGDNMSSFFGSSFMYALHLY